jgi:hypothetical protein
MIDQNQFQLTFIMSRFGYLVPNFFSVVGSSTITIIRKKKYYYYYSDAYFALYICIIHVGEK